MYLVVGLGNPGKKYEKTRHNVGFMMLSHFGVPIKRMKSRGLTAKGELFGEKVIFVKPQTYMNLSGECIYALAKFYKIPPEKIIVIYDEIYLPLGTVRTRMNGSDGGHNGMRNIIHHLDTQQFPRIRVGIGPTPEGEQIADYVLQEMSENELKIIDECFEKVLEGVKHIVSQNSRCDK